MMNDDLMTGDETVRKVDLNDLMDSKAVHAAAVAAGGVLDLDVNGEWFERVLAAKKGIELEAKAKDVERMAAVADAERRKEAEYAPYVEYAENVKQAGRLLPDSDAPASGNWQMTAKPSVDRRGGRRGYGPQDDTSRKINALLTYRREEYKKSRQIPPFIHSCDCIPVNHATVKHWAPEVRANWNVKEWDCQDWEYRCDICDNC
jgi:hypothetical protein